MRNNKTPSPDGSPVQFFKKCNKLASPQLYNGARERGSLPPTLTQASMSLLLKKVKTLFSVPLIGICRFLTLTLRLLAKTSATCLEKFLPIIISEEHNSFTKGCQLVFTVRTLLNVIFSGLSSSTPEVVTLIDAEKAFDRVEWQNLFEVLQLFCLGNKFITRIQLLYTSPQASVHTNNS